MKIQLVNGLPIISFPLTYNNQTILLNNVLLDTGCSTTIFDTDIVDKVGLEIDFISGKSVRMFGVGGQSELCYQQAVSNLLIDHLSLQNFTIQLGITKESYGFEAILGIDIMLHFGFKIDFVNLKVLYNL
ncbi:aspartyl protease family protein [Paenibacillus sp. BR2-3]|uniref:hypothetical protein n=1 Tax=Paenibacillus sp. BR2-3 TaxID=3048494 RepID=UPI003977D3C4